ncbi:hypothetical protein ACWCOW_32350 [Streptomyces sp. NPDC001939]
MAALIPAAVRLKGGVDEVIGWKLRNLYQQLALKLSGPTISNGLMLAIHQAAKGIDFTVIRRRAARPVRTVHKIPATTGQHQGGGAAVARTAG